MHPIIKEIEAGQLQERPEFRQADTVKVSIQINDGTRKRDQEFTGVVIAKRNRGMNSSFTVRRVSHGEAVERTFQLHAPNIRVELVRKGVSRRAKLYFLRELSGKKARIKERISHKSKSDEATS